MLRRGLLPVTTWPEIDARLRPFVARRLAPADVDDVLQDIFVRMHRGLGALRDDERFVSWLFQIARSAVAEHFRAAQRHPVAGEDGVEPEAPPPDGDDRAAADALAGCISVFVARLPSPYREAVTLVELEGLTAREAADMVGISVSGMKSRVQRGRAQLRRLFDECCAIAVDARGKPTDFTPRHACCRAR